MTSSNEVRSRNLNVSWLGTFMAGMAFSEAMPFLSLYISSLGSYTHSQAASYTGLAYGASYVIVIVTSPLWGKLADRTGRKKMMVRTSIGMATVILLIGLATNVWQIIALRAIQGLFDGYTPSATALISAETPDKDKTRIISKLSTGYIIGGLLGPLIGGLLGNIFSYRFIFIVTSMILFFVGMLSQFGINEHFEKPVFEKKVNSYKERNISLIPKFSKVILLLLSLSMLIQLVESLITPFISLFVKEMMTNQKYVTLVAGIIVALPGLATAIFALFTNNLANKFGDVKLLRIMDIVAVITYLCLGFNKYLIGLAILRFICGICNAVLLPITQALISKSTKNVSTVFSWCLSAQSLGSLIGSLSGGFILQIFSMNVMFIIASLFMLIGYFIIINLN